MKIIGIVSGTSADGIDVALADVNGVPPQLQAKITHKAHMDYSKDVRERIFQAIEPETGQVDLICRLNVDIARDFARAALDLIKQAGLQPADIDLISSHGQTVWHDVTPEGDVKGTLQIGEAADIAEITGITTINNLRARDVAAGGQGAPLVSYVDWLLLRHESEWRAVQNIGGMGNVTFLPPLSDDDSTPLAFDTGPGNVLIDTAVAQLTRSAQLYDKNGQMAAQGDVDEDWLTTLLEHPYFSRKPPKTTGRELFGTSMGLSLVAEGRARSLQHRDIIATITALTAHSIAAAYERFAPAKVADVIIGGGGGRNATMMKMLQETLGDVPVRSHEDVGFDSDFKEALMLAVLGYETWHNRPSSHPALTGVVRPVVLGQITPGANYVDLIKQTWA